jgi:hypothetical protein
VVRAWEGPRQEDRGPADGQSEQRDQLNKHGAETGNFEYRDACCCCFEDASYLLLVVAWKGVYGLCFARIVLIRNEDDHTNKQLSIILAAGANATALNRTVSTCVQRANCQSIL